MHSWVLVLKIFKHFHPSIIFDTVCTPKSTRIPMFENKKSHTHTQSHTHWHTHTQVYLSLIYIIQNFYNIGPLGHIHNTSFSLYVMNEPNKLECYSTLGLLGPLIQAAKRMKCSEYCLWFLWRKLKTTEVAQRSNNQLMILRSRVRIQAPTEKT